MPLRSSLIESNTDLILEADITARLENAIAQRINRDRYDLWFRDNSKLLIREQEVIIGVTNVMSQEWLSDTFGQDVRSAVAEVCGAGMSVRFAIDPDLFRAARAEEQRISAAHEHPAITVAVAPPARDGLRKPRGKRKWRSLHDFVVGPCNRVAHASAVSVVEDPLHNMNPLVIYGPVGTGKTHLLEGIHAGLKSRRDDLSICFPTAEQFTNSFLQTMHEGKQSVFRSRYRDCNILLIDDLNFLIGKKATQIEFLHTFDAIAADHGQIVLTTDCHPRLCDDFLPELVDRLLGGAVWGLMPPDPETRLGLLRSKAAQASPLIPDEVLRMLADELRGNVRELEGAIFSLRHYARVANRNVDLTMAREALSDLLRHAVRRVGVKEVDESVCAITGIKLGALQEKNRCWAVSHPRMIAIYLCRKHTAATYAEISSHFSVKTHSSAVAAEKKVRQWLQKNERIRIGEREWRASELIEKIERNLGR